MNNDPIPTATTSLDTHLRNTRWLVIFSLLALNVWRVYWFSAAFPFFSNVDEEAHLDTVIKYAKGKLPNRADDAFKLEPESSELVLMYRSPEYFWNENTSYRGRPFWKRIQQAGGREEVEEARKKWAWPDNHEAFSPPVYYTIAGLWLNFGKMLGLYGGSLLYWVRFLNIPVAIAIFTLTVWVSDRLFQGDLQAQFAVLLLLAVFPQDVFYSINSDVLSPLFCVICLSLLLRNGEVNLPVWRYLLAGLSVALAVMTKLTNLPLVVILLVWGIAHFGRLRSEHRLKSQAIGLLAGVIGCALPITGWAIFNLRSLGDLTGNAAKVRSLGWTAKPFSELFDHPLFTWSGGTYFLGEVIETFWRGEFYWHNRRLSFQLIDWLYVSTSLLFVSISVFHAFRSDRHTKALNARFVRLAGFLLVLELLQLAVLSTLWDFGDSPYPSRALPYFTSGRLMLGCLIPFLLLYVDGLARLLSLIRKRQHLLLVVCSFSLIILGSEFVLSLSPRESSFNWFHLKGDIKSAVTSSSFK